MTDGGLIAVIGLSLLVAVGLLSALAVAFPTSEELGEFVRKHRLPPRRP